MDEIEKNKIKEDYLNIQNELDQIGVLHLNMLNKLPDVHASNYRIKEIDHLIRKIDSKNSEGRNITFDNYKQEITDLIGIRILHIFKDGWKNIDKYIRDNYETIEQPKAYIRLGDDIDNLEEVNFEISEQDSGYRSFHYVIKSKHGKN
jgi:GTP pyrophosphokinase